ncbi:50S ribosomal protein L18 [Estrella lausannensis]|uniref:Large ribosomal subunit protein uL18 n=1 Tax=Estrella lausannensis TaxID=483423 RepID=A0A0H5DNM8_9BACT|nr:50S ribosomal protein L18 [Estrella lausannensis]CRX37862.1 50S ribosomal protein L18 [Estrella lausannensis]
MKNSQSNKVRIQKKRAMRIRKKLRGSSEFPRMCVVKTNKHIMVQIIDDESHKTLCSASTLSKELKGTEFAKKSKASAAKLGEVIAKAAQGLNIKKVKFDRGQFKYHGILAELADAARNAGLQI